MKWNIKLKTIAVSFCSANCFWNTWYIFVVVFLFVLFLTRKLQASEALRNTSHSCTAADLLQAKQQILSHQQQLEEQECLLKNYQKKNEEFQVQIAHLHDKIKTYEMVCSLLEKISFAIVSFYDFVVPLKYKAQSMDYECATCNAYRVFKSV